MSRARVYMNLIESIARRTHGRGKSSPEKREIIRERPALHYPRVSVSRRHDKREEARSVKVRRGVVSLGKPRPTSLPALQYRVARGPSSHVHSTSLHLLSLSRPIEETSFLFFLFLSFSFVSWNFHRHLVLLDFFTSEWNFVVLSHDRGESTTVTFIHRVLSSLFVFFFSCGFIRIIYLYFLFEWNFIVLLHDRGKSTYFTPITFTYDREKFFFFSCRILVDIAMTLVFL